MLLHGPAGCGKTSLARHVAAAASAKFLASGLTPERLRVPYEDIMEEAFSLDTIGKVKRKEQCEAQLRQPSFPFHQFLSFYEDCQGIEQAEAFILFLSVDVLQRPYCQMEIRHALALKKPMVLIHGA